MNTIPAHKTQNYKANNLTITDTIFQSSIPYWFSRSRIANDVYKHVTSSFAFLIPEYSWGNHHQIHKITGKFKHNLQRRNLLTR
jgi:hypothetical protein